MKLNNDNSWEILYPDDCIRFIEAFRRKYWNHESVCTILDSFFKANSNIKTICELGSGGGTNLFALEKFGYNCLGVERNKESVEMSNNRAIESGSNVRFIEASFMDELNIEVQDAIVSLFVPISIADMKDLGLQAAPYIRKGGYFACMLLAVLPDYEEINHTSKYDMETLEVDGDRVIRFNFYVKNGNKISYEGVYIANSSGSPNMFVDKDIYELVNNERLIDFPDSMYTHVTRLPIIAKSGQAPPMTFELIDIYQKL